MFNLTPPFVKNAMIDDTILNKGYLNNYLFDIFPPLLTFFTNIKDCRHTLQSFKVNEYLSVEETLFLGLYPGHFSICSVIT